MRDHVGGGLEPVGELVGLRDIDDLVPHLVDVAREPGDRGVRLCVHLERELLRGDELVVGKLLGDGDYVRRRGEDNERAARVQSLERVLSLEELAVGVEDIVVLVWLRHLGLENNTVIRGMHKLYQV